jgi:uncharacterized alpha-E superfamily protein
MISRVAESCFWLNRYMERVEVLARMLGVNAAFQLDVDLPDADRWRPLVVVTGQEADFVSRTKPELADDPETVQHYLTWSEENPSSLYSSVRAARENARTVRETISLEMWETLNDLWVWLGDRSSERLWKSDRQAFYARLKNDCLLFHGVANATMLHEDPFEFMRLGTALERVSQTARVLDIKYHVIGPTRDSDESHVEIAQWLATLRFCSGVEPFTKRVTAVPSGKAVAEFLLFDPAFPRSVHHNLARTGNFLQLVRPPGVPVSALEGETLLRESLAEFRSMSIDSMLAEGLHEKLEWIVGVTAEISHAIARDFFDPTPKRPGKPIQTQAQGQTTAANGSPDP